jgi:hypothetical protein
MLATAQETEMTEDVAVASSAIGDATVNTEDTKAKSAGWDGIPETIRNLLYNPPVLPHETKIRSSRCLTASWTTRRPKTSSSFT